MGAIAPDMGAKEIYSLSSALFGKTRCAMLSLFFSRPEEAFYMRQVTALTRTGQGAAQRELDRLSMAGIITRDKRGTRVFYQANRGCPIFEELYSLMLKTAGLADVVRKALGAMSKQINWAFIYGSLALGMAVAASDVDLLIVGEVDEIVLHRAVVDAEKSLARTIHYTFLHPEDFQKRRREKGGFIQRILKGNKITIMGDASDV